MRRLVPAMLFGPCTFATALAGDLTVRVTGIADAAGQVRVAACTEQEFLKRCRLTASAPARPGSLELTLPAVPPGRYAVQAFHDRDGDGQLATNLVGLPTEPYGFSRASAGRFGPPAFSDAAITVEGRPATVTVAVKR